jgi:hypothetical protein
MTLNTVFGPYLDWSDNFRSPRRSNESRTLTMFRLSGNCRRELGKKALELKGNAVLGVQQYFDLESSQKSITVRSIGTAVKIVKVDSLCMDVPFAASRYINCNEAHTLA